jgi:hypothetical protein
VSDEKPRGWKFGIPFRNSTATTDSSATYVDSETSQGHLDSSTGSPVPPYLSAGIPTIAENDPFPHLDGTPVIPGLELPASTPHRAGLTPELPDKEVARPGRAELSPEPERLPINVSPNLKRVSTTSLPTTQTRMAESSSSTFPYSVEAVENCCLMQSNLNTLNRHDNQQAFSRNGKNHVMSWMYYENDSLSAVSTTTDPSDEEAGRHGLGIQGVTNTS